LTPPEPGEPLPTQGPAANRPTPWGSPSYPAAWDERTPARPGQGRRGWRTPEKAGEGWRGLENAREA
ncbi:hypothetical protein P7K49_037613, partial [Saguinus oedipus]